MISRARSFRHARRLTARVKSSQVLRFLIAGSLAAGVNWLACRALSLILPFTVAVAFAQIVGWAAGFVLYRAHVFQGSTLPWRMQLARFLAVNVATGLETWVLAVALARWGLPAAGLPAGAKSEAIAHAVAIAVAAATSYAGHRFVSFGRFHRGDDFPHG